VEGRGDDRPDPGRDGGEDRPKGVSFAQARRALPEGTFTGRADGRRYVVTRHVLNGGRTVKLVAEELGGRDYISLNWFDLAAGPRLKPCEMPEAKVRAFVAELVPD